MRHAFLRPSTLTALLLLASACGGPTSGVDEDCSTPGANRCNGSVIEACAANSAGVLVWRAGVDCSATGMVCDPSGQCVKETTGGGGDDGGVNQTDGGNNNTAHCSNGARDEDESDVDCGGSCSACPDGKACTDNEDCASAKCGGTPSAPVCTTLAPNCTDGVKNSNETDVDCGGTCGSCAVGKACTVHTDCATGVCDLLATQTCIAATPSYTTNEDFETGDLSKFPYVNQATADHAWMIETTAASCHAGSYCLRTSNLHALDETSSFSVSLSVRQDTQITFWAKVHTETDNHYFRFFIDGVEQVAVSGDHDWKLYSFPVSATGPNGPNRVFKWEYQRSSYVDPNHVPWNEVWIDDVDFPDWNTEPTVPQLLTPWNGKLTTNLQPTFRWQSFDADFDPITYELQYDTSPSFSNPVSTGETNTPSFVPPSALSDHALYYWRVRAKDNSNYRWSNWSSTWVVDLDSTYEYASVWRQTDASQFSMNALTDITVNASSVVPVSVSTPQNLSKSAGIVQTGGTSQVTFTSMKSCSGNATLTISANGDFDATGESANVYVDNVFVGTYAPLACSASRTFSVACSHFSDGTATVKFTTSAGVGGGCANGNWTANFTYNSAVQSTGNMVSVPIDFSLFDGKTLWEKVQVVGAGEVVLQVLDGTSGALIPDSELPGNSTGTTARTLRLWNLDVALHPVIKLKATLTPGSSIEEWSVVGNDVHEWLFSKDGDSEGWGAFDNGATPSLSVSAGVLKLSSLAAGTDPHVQYAFPQALPASRFTRLEVRVRTSNNYANDNPKLFWESNYGLFDSRRSFTLPNEFLVTFKDLSFDLTQAPVSPNEPWQGNIEKLRLDPAERFLDQAGAPADGWFEIERIAIY